MTSNIETMKKSGFYKLGIHRGILSILDNFNFLTPTPIQEKAITPAIQGKDLIGVAQTGTGKTLAFGIPMIQGAMIGKKGLVVLPTRELTLQVFETFQKIGSGLGLRCALLIGGESMWRQVSALKNNPHIIIGTPGRIIDHLNHKTLSLKMISILTLDEADRMLDMGFLPQLKRILEILPRERQTMLFSATMPESIINIAKNYMRQPIKVEITSSYVTADKISQEVFFLSKNDKPRLLEKILLDYKRTVLVFSRTKHGAKKITRSVREAGHSTAELHSNRSLNQRKEALQGFKNGKYRVLVATDIAARGIDVSGIELVVNYDLPHHAEDYIHRIGRTGRAGKTGHAVSFATPNEGGDVRKIERLIRINLPLSKLPDLPPVRTASFTSERQQGHSRFFNKNRRFR